MDEGQRTQASIKEEVSESGREGGPYFQKRKTPWVKTSEQHMHITEKTHRWVTGVRPQWSSDQVRGAQSHKMRRCRA